MASGVPDAARTCTHAKLDITHTHTHEPCVDDDHFQFAVGCAAKYTLKNLIVLDYLPLPQIPTNAGRISMEMSGLWQPEKAKQKMLSQEPRGIHTYLDLLLAADRLFDLINPDVSSSVEADCSHGEG